MSQPAFKPPSDKRLAIFFWDGHLAVAPSLTAAMEQLAEDGWEVDVFIRGLGEAIGPLGAIPARVRILDPAPARFLSSARVARMLPSRVGVGAGIVWFLMLAWREARKRRYRAVFGADAIGGYCGAQIARWLAVPFFYWSLEILLARDALRLHERVTVRLARYAARRSEWIIVQDPARARVFLDETRPGHERVLLVPNGPSGPPNTRRSTLLHQRLGIPQDRRIVLHAGMIGDWVLSGALARSVHAWPDPYCLVLHSNEPRRRDESDIRELLEIGEPRLYLSLDPVAANEVDELVSSAAVGLATYAQGLGPNWDLIAYASGKLGHYLRNGLPVICSDHPGMRELLDGFGCGVVIGDVAEVPAALDRISANYAAFRKGAFECYKRRYEFSAHFGAVLATLAQVTGQPRPSPSEALAWK